MAGPRISGPPAPLFAATIFVSSFLIFLVQPLLSRTILPWHGGSPAVWTTALLFFQTTLFAGYAYAHLARRFLPGAWPFRLHAILVLAAAVALPIIPAETWQPRGGEDPTWLIVGMLAATVGAPFLLLAGTGPLLQSWFAAAHPGRSPFALFATSNTGSVLALAAYPLVVERLWGGERQAWLWSGGYVLLVALLAVLTILSGRREPAPPGQTATERSAERPTPGRRAFWLGWSLLGVVSFMAVTLQLTENIATLPLLWIVPLAAYLVSFIITFAGERFYSRRVLSPLTALALLVVWAVTPGQFVGLGLDLAFSAWAQIGLFGAGVLLVTTTCHGELFRLRPDAEYLTEFYLLVAAGGMAGGILVGAVAPAVLPAAGELHLALVAVPALFLATRLRETGRRLQSRGPRAGLAIGILFTVLMGILATRQAADLAGDALHTHRNFFGTISAHLLDGDTDRHRRLIMKHGATKHGAQYLKESYRPLPTTYYSPFTGVGLALTAYQELHGQDRGLKVGVVGLGVGTLAAYGRAGDTYRFYEINPAVQELATRTYGDPDLRFTYLADCQADWTVVTGDGRLQLARELASAPAGGTFDVLVLDAFTSGAIPVHLLTREAVQLYADHLRTDGVLAVHVSNKSIDLAPVIKRVADDRGFRCVQAVNERRDFTDAPGVDCDISNRSEWMILYRDEDFARELATLMRPLVREGELAVTRGENIPVLAGRVWTDDYSNLLGALR
ncbi:MAG: spermidine synthase [bacterium]|nr:spermidine synthase [bacterium]